MTPDVLRRLADDLEEIAGAATVGPWRYRIQDGDHTVRSEPDGFVVFADDASGANAEGDAKWIATVGPQIVDALARTLRAAGADTEYAAVAGAPRSATVLAVHDLARALMGEDNHG